MFSHLTHLRVRYAETDKMGYVYYGAYAQYLEVGRVEALRSLGISYRGLEDQGVMLPVHDLSVKYHRPARYDDLLSVRTTILQVPGVRIQFSYVVHNEAGELISEASTTLVFVDAATMRPRRAPQKLIDLLAPFFP